MTNNNQEILSGNSILFIDSTIREYETLIDNITQATNIIILDAQRDGIVQITESLQQYDDLDAIHIVSHGDAGELSLGNVKLNQNTLSSYVNDLISWQDSIADNGDILLYGCNVAESEADKEFIEELSQYTAADILASTDLTGSEDLGGDWDLEYAIGGIEENLAFDAKTQSSYQHILFGLDSFSGTYTGTNFSDFSGSDFYFDDDINFDTDFYFDNDFDFNTNIDLPSPSESDNIANIDLEQYDFSNPAYNTVLLNFEPSQINFNTNDFNYDSVDIDNNSITFGFKSGVDFTPSAESIESLEFDFDNYTFDFDSKFSFNADSVTFEKDKVKFEFDSNSLNFNGADLFSADNVHLFEYKFLNDEITLPDGELTFADLNASDFRALDYAFAGDELFDGEYYFDNNVIPADMNPFTDYIENGWKLGLDPHPLFDTSYYLNKNIDVRNEGVEPFQHYITQGYTERTNPNRDPHPLFDTSYYQENNADVVKANKNPLSHYIEDGYNENFDTRDPNPLFDSSYYNQKNPDVVKEGMNPLVHYTQFGWQESRINNPGGFNPNRDPNAFFDTSFYFEKHDDVLKASYFYDSANPVQHMLQFGFVELRITNSYSQSEKVAKIIKVFTPDSDPGEILNLQKNLKKDGIELSIYDDKTFKISESIWDPIIDPIKRKGEALLGGLAAWGIYKLSRFSDEAIDAGVELWQILEDGFEDVGKAFTFSGYTGIPLNTFQTDAVTIDYGDSSLSDLLRIRPFPGQTESQIAVEIFNTPDIDGVEDFTILPEDSGVFLPTTGFPQGDKTLEAILNDGLFVNGEEDPLGGYVLASTRDGKPLIYNPKLLGNSLDIDWDSRLANQRLQLDLTQDPLIGQKIVIPGRDTNDPTHGLFYDPNKNTTQLRSGTIRSSATDRTIEEFNILYSGNLPNEVRITFDHAEGNAASIIRQFDLPSGTIVINYEDGPCPYCQGLSQNQLGGIAQILKDGQTLNVIYPSKSGQIRRDTYTGGKIFNPKTDRKIF